MPKRASTMMTGRISVHQGSGRRVLPSRDSGKSVGEPAIKQPPACCRVVNTQIISSENYRQVDERPIYRMVWISASMEMWVAGTPSIEYFSPADSENWKKRLI